MKTLDKIFIIIILTCLTIAACATTALFAALVHTYYGPIAGLFTFVSCVLPWPFIAIAAYKSGELI